MRDARLEFLRVGGGYRFVHRAPDGGQHVFYGQYLEIHSKKAAARPWLPGARSSPPFRHVTCT